MRFPWQKPVPKPDSRRNMVDELSQQGYRMTPQRLMIVYAIETSTEHISAEEIHAQVVVKYPNVNVSTVYRTLELLEQRGLVTKTDMGGGRVMYHPVEKGHHHHLICRECGATVDLGESALAPLRDTLLRDYQFIAELRHMGIVGLCVNCKKKTPNKSEGNDNE